MTWTKNAELQQQVQSSEGEKYGPTTVDQEGS